MIERFFEKVSPEPNSGCWIWAAAVNYRGYGRFRFGRKTVAAHRVSWMIHYGEIPDGLFVLHRCDVPLCVNPDHLFLGFHADNMVDMIAKGRSAGAKGTHNNALKTHCPHGHPYDEANTGIRSDNGGRRCRACDNARNREYKRRKRG